MKRNSLNLVLLLCVWLAGSLGIVWAVGASVCTQSSKHFPLDVRQPNASLPFRGTLRISPKAVGNGTAATLLVDGKAAAGWSRTKPMYDSTKLADGWHVFTLKEAGQESSVRIYVLNDPKYVFQEGIVDGKVVWRADKFHLVNGWVSIEEGCQVLLEDGAKVLLAYGANFTGEVQPSALGALSLFHLVHPRMLESDGKETEIVAQGATVVPRWPWNGLVDITYSVDFACGADPSIEAWTNVSGWDFVRSQAVPMSSLVGDGLDAQLAAGGPYKIVWDAGKDMPNFNSTAFAVSIQMQSDYLVVDLSGGPEAESYPVRFSTIGPNLADDACRTTELWLRRIPRGTFTMGSPKDELGRGADETQHQVTLTPCYIGVFEMTQKQYELVMGSNPSKYQGDTRPVEQVSYDDLRGTSAEGGAGWPAKGHAVDATSFFGVLRAKTGLEFDLPTEAQWEYACRAGTTTALNSGKNLTATDECPNLAEVGRYYYNRNDGKGGYGEHTKVGCYLPNAWGLYDMHGNVWEWCLDRWGDYSTDAVTDPAGADSGSTRVVRGGSWNNVAQDCRSASRSSSVYGPSYRNSLIGFRLVCLPAAQE